MTLVEERNGGRLEEDGESGTNSGKEDVHIAELSLDDRKPHLADVPRASWGSSGNLASNYKPGPGTLSPPLACTDKACHSVGHDVADYVVECVVQYVVELECEEWRRLPVSLGTMPGMADAQSERWEAGLA